MVRQPSECGRQPNRPGRRQCRHFDESVAKQCKEPFAEVPSDKDDANFCEFFQIGDGGLTGEANRNKFLSEAEALFAKK
jgi:hypothetical protein